MTEETLLLAGHMKREEAVNVRWLMIKLLVNVPAQTHASKFMATNACIRT